MPSTYIPALPALLAVNAVVPQAMNGPSAATWATAAGVFVLMALLATLRRPDIQKELRIPLVMMLGWSVVTILWATPFWSTGLRDWCELLSLVTLALASVRVGWIFVVDWALNRGAALGISQLSRDLVLGFLYLVSAIAAARAAGADAQSLATTGGLVTAGLTFSLQQTLGDLVAGLLLQAKAPFRVGDWIGYSDRAHEVGRVVEINWRATKVVTVEQVEITVPNSVLAKASIVNFNEPVPEARRSFKFTVDYDEQPKLIERLAMDATIGVPGVLREPAPSVLLVEFADAGVTYSLRYFITQIDIADPIDSRVRVRLWHAFRRAGVSFVFPRMDLSLVQDHGDRGRLDPTELARRMQTFGKIDFATALSEGGLEMLARNARMELFSAGEVIVREGDLTSDMYLLATGHVAVTIDQGKREVAQLAAGDVFGEMALLTGEPRGATVTAADDCTLYVIEKATLQGILSEHPEVMGRISTIVAERQEEIARKRGESDSTGQHRAALESTLLTRMRRFFFG